MVKQLIKRLKPLARAILSQLRRKPRGQYETEKAEQTFYIDYLQPGMVAFDVGANIGEISLLFSRFVGPNGRVHSFECAPDTFTRLQQIIATARRKNIIPNNVCLLDKQGTVSFHVYDEEHAAWNTIADRPLENYGINIKPVRTEALVATTIDSYCASFSIPKIDLLKVDVEGAEYQVIKGASRMLKEKRIGCLIFEFGQTTFDMGNTPAGLQDLIASHGYRIRNLIKGDPIFPGGESVATAEFSMHVCTPE
jgi:FkbM family methyltransferase